MNEEERDHVSCYLRDRLGEIANLKNRCIITYLDQEDKYVKVTGLIVDIYAVDSMDWCKLSNGVSIRLDRIQDFEYEEISLI